MARRDAGQGGLFPVRWKKTATGEWALDSRGERIPTLWRGTVDCGWREDGSKDIRYVSASTKRACADKLDELKKEIAANGGKAPDRALTVETWGRQWLASHQHDIDSKTWKNYASLLERHIIPLLGKRKLTALVESDAAKLRREMLDRKGLSTSQTKQAGVVLSLLVAAAHREKKIAHNGLERVRQVKVTPKATRSPLPKTTAAKLWQHLVAMPDGAGARAALQLASGARQGEILGAEISQLVEADDGWGYLTIGWKLEDIPREHGCSDGSPTCGFKRGAFCPQARWVVKDGVEVRHLEGAGRWALTRPKNDKERIVPISPDLLAMIRAHLAAHADEQNPYGLIFRRPTGMPIDPKEDQAALRAVFAEVGIPANVTSHWLRHSAVSLAASVPGMDLKTVAKVTGHSERVAAEIYRKQDLEELRRVVSGLDGVLSAPQIEPPKSEDVA